MLLARGLYMMGLKMTLCTQVGVDVPGSRVNAVGPVFYDYIILRSLMLSIAVERSVHKSLLSTKHHRG